MKFNKSSHLCLMLTIRAISWKFIRELGGGRYTCTFTEFYMSSGSPGITVA